MRGRLTVALAAHAFGSEVAVMAGDRVLVVDDNPLNSGLMADTLTFDGYAVQTAVDAEEAQRLIETFDPSLIVMDIQLPGMDGLTLTRLLKSQRATRRIRIVAVTSYAMKGDEEKALAAGCDGYIAKPISTRTFGQQIGSYLVGAPHPKAERNNRNRH